MFNLFRYSCTLDGISKSFIDLQVKAYYSKKKIISGRLRKGPKVNKLIDMKETVLEKKTCDEIETVNFDDEEILQTEVTEKEKDANVHSRLSKEYNKILDKTMTLRSSSGLNVHLLPETEKNTNWEDYMFDKTVQNLQKQTLAPILQTKGPSDGISGRTISGGSGDQSISSIDRIRRREPGKVLFAFLPIEWFEFFIPKTGVTGLGTFCATFGTFLISKEIYVLEHNFYNGLGMFFVVWGAIKYVGPVLVKYLDGEVDAYEKAWQKGRDQHKAQLEEQIDDENLLQFQCEGQTMLIEAKRENVKLQLEEEFRLRQMMVYKAVLQRLDYHIAVGEVYKKIFHKNLVDYVTKEVMKAITPDMEQKILNVSIENLVSELEKDNKK